MILFPLNVSSENIILFRCCHIDHVKASHQHFHLLILIPIAAPFICCKKCCFGFCGKAPTNFTQDIHFHQIGMILLQWKNRCPASSSALLQKRHLPSFITTWRLCKFILVSSLSLINLHAKTVILLGTFSFHRSPYTPSVVPYAASLFIILYALLTEYWPLGSAFHTQSSRLCG